jgi:chemotaxis regulatin CheY-phosphate phosphatase CheZ
MTALIALHEVKLQSLLQGFGLDEDVHHAAMEHFVVDVDRHEKVVGMTGPVHEGVTESVDAAAAHTDLADALDCELHPRVVQEKAAGAVHIADSLVAQLAA